MPKITFGAHPLGYDGLSADDPGIVVLHHFLGSWKMRKLGWKQNKQIIAKLLKKLFGPKQLMYARFNPDPVLRSDPPKI